jgi:hypothetical protein
MGTTKTHVVEIAVLANRRLAPEVHVGCPLTMM